VLQGENDSDCVTAELTVILKARDSSEDRLENILFLYQREMFVGKKDPEISSVLKRFNNEVERNKNRSSMGIPTGFRFLDDLYVQYIPGHIWTIGAYTSVGKTAVMVQKLCNLIAMDIDLSLLVISTEMTEQQVVARILANFTGVHSYRILSGKFRHGEEEEVERYKSLLKENGC
jgi:replicative DNA helicase